MLCRLAKPLGKALMTHGSSSFEAHKLRDVTLTLHKAHTLHTSRAFCGAHLNHVKGRGADLCVQWTSSCTCTRDWTHWGRRSTVSACACSGQSGGGRGHVVTHQSGSDYALHMTKSGLIGNVRFPRLFNRYFYSRAMQTRASSTAAKPRESSEEQPPRASHTGDEQPLKEPSSPPDNPEPVPDGGKPNKTQQLKKVFKEYGAVGVSFHICMSLMSLGMFYLLVSSGIDMGALLCKVGFSESVVQSKMAAGTSTFVLAYAIHKLFAPVRISITLVSVPLIVRHFRKIGLFKAPPTAP